MCGFAENCCIYSNDRSMHCIMHIINYTYKVYFVDLVVPQGEVPEVPPGPATPFLRVINMSQM